MGKTGLSRSWHVIYTRSRFENVVLEGLRGKSMEAFLPRITVSRRRRDRRVALQVPMFPGYLFVKTDMAPSEHLEIKKTVGVVTLVGNAGGPIPVPDHAVESLQIMARADSGVATGRAVRAGSRVMVVGGPFAGVEGALVRRKGKGRVIVNIDPLDRFAGVEIDMDDIEVLPDMGR
ncbi:Transcriptional antiterminator [Candidatus Desulfarcum epimagneticum]|uniref:Transcriptional antiterminator n=1 Tax=uncultured Desulfobacteraceae bacterium TaxID=218296 RepID=A0A484HGD3_9BACT|nr:Transcriptional antiterminator [uncultured Desulfobacteraceae bacterium]